MHEMVGTGLEQYLSTLENFCFSWLECLMGPVDAYMQPVQMLECYIGQTNSSSCTSVSLSSQLKQGHYIWNFISLTVTPRSHCPAVRTGASPQFVHFSNTLLNSHIILLALVSVCVAITVVVNPVNVC